VRRPLDAPAPGSGGVGTVLEGSRNRSQAQVSTLGSEGSKSLSHDGGSAAE